MIAGIPPWLTWTILLVLAVNVVALVWALVAWLTSPTERDFRRWEKETKHDEKEG